MVPWNATKEMSNVMDNYNPPIVTSVGRQWTESTNIGFNQWLSLAKLALKMPPLVGIVHWWPEPTGVGSVLYEFTIYGV